MCVIVAKNKGIDLPSKEILKNCFDNNNDGVGFAFVNSNKEVVISKGYKKFDNFYNDLMKVDKKLNLKNKGLLIHFRISTSGLIDAGNCHPFPLSNDKNELRETKTKTKIAICHNGIISKYNKKDNVLNDTQLFIKNVVYPFSKLDKEFYKNNFIMDTIKELANSKLAFLDSEENIYLLGEFVKENDLYFSNTSYIKRTFTYSNYRYFDYDYDDYYSYNYWFNKKKKKTTAEQTKKEEKKQLQTTFKWDILTYENIILSDSIKNNLIKNSLIELKTNYKVETAEDKKQYKVNKNNTFYSDYSLNMYELKNDNRFVKIADIDKIYINNKDFTNDLLMGFK